MTGMGKKALFMAFFVLGVFNSGFMEKNEGCSQPMCSEEHPQSGTICQSSIVEGDGYYGLDDEVIELVPQFGIVGNSNAGMGVEDWWEGSPTIVCVDEYGAKGDGVTDDTKAFKKAWKKACSSISAMFLVPHGKKYLVKPTKFSGPCKSAMTIQVSGIIIAPGDPKVWEGLNRRPWIRFKGINNLTVEGGGTFNGNGEQWWAQSCKINKTNPCVSAPIAVRFDSINNLRLRNLLLKNSQQMHVKFSKCVGVEADNLKVFAPAHSPNTDGIHISASKHVVIKNSIIGTGDDCISIVSGSSNIQIINIICGPGHGISIGSLGKWNSEAHVSRVMIDGASLSNTTNGLRIKTWQGGSGVAKQIIFQNVHMENVKHPIIINQYYCDSQKPCPTKTSNVKVSNVTYSNIKGTSASKEVMRFSCAESVPCENINLEDVHLTVASGSTPTTFCENVIGFTITTVSPPPCLQSCKLCEVAHAATKDDSLLRKDEL